MIFDAILGLVFSLIAAALGGVVALVPTVPDWAVTALGVYDAVMAHVREFDTWIPVNFMFVVAATVVFAYLISMTAEITRLVLSFLTLGGGAK